MAVLNVLRDHDEIRALLPDLTSEKELAGAIGGQFGNDQLVYLAGVETAFVWYLGTGDSPVTAEHRPPDGLLLDLEWHELRGMVENGNDHKGFDPKYVLGAYRAIRYLRSDAQGIVHPLQYV